MNIQINHRFTLAILHEGDYASILEVINDAVRLGKNLRGADLRGTDLRGVKNLELIIAQTRILPDEGSVIGWKKCKNKVIVKLKIEENTRRSHAFGRKCRADFVTVLEVFNGEFGVSSHDGKTIYKKGEIVKCNNWNEDFTQECAGGIHFFITRIEAENYIV